MDFESFYISKIELHNVRCFKHLSLDILVGNKPRMRTVLIGRNGTCKTTLLRCIALGLSDRHDADSLLSEQFGLIITEGATRATIQISLKEDGGSGRVLTLTKNIERLNGKEVVSIANDTSDIDVSGVFCVAYGAGRSNEGEGDVRPFRLLDSMYSLFNYRAELVYPELVLRRLNDYLGDSMFDKAKAGIIKALSLSPKDTIEFIKGGGVVFSGPSVGNSKIPFEGLADGYRLTFNWILDLYSWAMRAKTLDESGDMFGVLLIDELEQHLHPSLQSSLCNNLSKLFPRLQIITTTHSPLVALGATTEEIVAFHKKGKWVKTISDLPDISGYSAEDVLVDHRMFNTEVYSEKTNI